MHKSFVGRFSGALSDCHAFEVDEWALSLRSLSQAVQLKNRLLPDQVIMMHFQPDGTL